MDNPIDKEFTPYLRENAEDEVLQIVMALPKELKELGLVILFRDEKARKISYYKTKAYNSYHKRKKAFSATFNKLNKKNKQKLIQCFCPSLSDEILTAYEFNKRLPFSDHYDYSTASRVSTKSIQSTENASAWLIDFLSKAFMVDPSHLSTEWLTTNAAPVESALHLSDMNSARFIASVICENSKQGNSVYELLKEIVLDNKKGNILGESQPLMGRHVVVALLMANRSEGWQLVLNLLVAAQRQEGLRFEILEAVYYADPDAYPAIFNSIVQNKLTRFSSISQMLTCYLGFSYQPITSTNLNKILSVVSKLLNDKPNATTWNSSDAQEIYLAIWVLGIQDEQQAIAKCRQLLSSKSAEIRFCALYYITHVRLTDNEELLHNCILDSDSRISTYAINHLFSTYDSDCKNNSIPDAVYERLEKLLPTVPKKGRAEAAAVWPWMTSEIKQESIAWALLHFPGKRSPLELIKYKEHFTSGMRTVLYSQISKVTTCEENERAALIDGLSDRSAYVVEECIKGFSGTPLSEDEVWGFESLLRRKNNDIRKQVINLFLKQDNNVVFDTANRLLYSSNINSRNAGIEILRRLVKKKHHSEKSQTLISTWLDTTKTKITADQEVQIEKILENRSETVTLDNALGLLSGKNRTKSIKPKPKNVTYFSTASIELLLQIDALVQKHALVEIDEPEDGEEQLLGNSFIAAPIKNIALEKQLSKLPLVDVWTVWLKDRPDTTKDEDGLEWIRARQILDTDCSYSKNDLITWIDRDPARAEKIAFPERLRGGLELQHEYQVSVILSWLTQLDSNGDKTTKTNDLILHAVEDLMSMVTKAENQKTKKADKVAGLHRKDWRNQWTLLSFWMQQLLSCNDLSESQQVRRYQLLNWYQQPISKAIYVHMDIRYLLEGRNSCAATDEDIIFNILGPRDAYYHGFSSLNVLTRNSHHPEKAKAISLYPGVSELVDKCRERVLEIELKRGEQKTVATMAALELLAVYGTQTLIQLLQLLGKDGFANVDSYSVDADDRRATFTLLAKRCYPDQNETTESIANLFRQAIEEKLFPEDRLLQLGFAAPQWINAIEHYYDWAGLKEAYYWFYAHLKYVWNGISNDALENDNSSDLITEDDIHPDSYRNNNSRWNQLVQERTDISEHDREEGVVDIKWFQKTRACLNANQWDAIAAAARYASSPAQAKQAAFIADVLTGKANRKKLISGITDRKLKDNVRLLGLLPIATKKDPQKDVLERYEILQDYRQYANQLSSMSKPDALQAVEIGFDNLARTAGYNDPLRLAWSLEAANTQDLAAGFLEVTKGDVTARLELMDSGKPKIEIKRNDRILKSVPASHKKDADIIQLRDRAKDIKTQHTRSRASLEEAMNRQIMFTGRELQALSQHTTLWPMLSNLVFVCKDAMGFPDKQGKKLRNFKGELQTVRVNYEYQIAHPHHFLKDKRWSKWQEDCFAANREQPFKQIFRELYPVSAQEKKDKLVSRRYAGHQINPGQAMALLGHRKWHTQDGVWKSFPDLQLTVSIEFDHDADLIGNIHALTMGTISFHHHVSREQVSLTEIDPIIYSEVMRDIDLVVSVAHIGEVDPEASASTVEFRQTLIKETSSLLQLGNVNVEKNHVIVKGTLSTYSIHIGSGVVHRVPGGEICIVPVHSQHRGRLFLPFADDDPKTAEIITKVVTLAKDDEIKDPTILEQLRR